jgi:hypothetical protein
VVGIVARRQGQSDLAAAQMRISEFPLRESVVNKLLGKRNRVGAHFKTNKAEATKLDSVSLSTGGVKMPWAQILQPAKPKRLQYRTQHLRFVRRRRRPREAEVVCCEDQRRYQPARQRNSQASGVGSACRPPFPDLA